MKSQTMAVTDYHRERTMENVQKEGTMEFQQDGSVVQVSGHVSQGHVVV